MQNPAPKVVCISCRLCPPAPRESHTVRDGWGTPQVIAQRSIQQDAQPRDAA
jgi:hypothetical protein